MTPEIIEAVAGLVFPTLGVMAIAVCILLVVGCITYMLEDKQ